MSFSSFTLRYKAIVISGAVLLMLWGSTSYLQMPRRENPEFTVKVCQILTNWPGAPAEQVEELITAPIEAEINELENLRWIYSESAVGRSAVFVELARALPPSEIDQMWDKVRSRLDRVRMPEPEIRPVLYDDFGDESVMLLAVFQEPLQGEDAVREANRYTPRDLEIFAERLRDELKLVDGVATARLSGVQREAIYIETDMANWSQLGLTADGLERLVSARNVVSPGGSLDTDDGTFTVKPSGDIDAVREISSIAVGSSGAGDTMVPVYLRDVGIDVVRGYLDPAQTICRYGRPGLSADAVILFFTMQAGANVEVVCAGARERVRELKEIDKVFPPDLGIEAVLDTSETVTRKVGDFVANVIAAIVIVVLIVVLMVGFRSAAVMAANIPLVIIGSLALVPLFGVQLEQISLAAMIIALGMLVDNAVQICDQTRRLMSEGKTPFRAAVDGSNELAFPIFIATMTTIAAFFPMLLGLQGSQREYVYSLPVTITVVLALSYVLAMTLCVLLAYQFIRVPASADTSASPVVQLWHKIRKPKPRPAGETSPWANLYPNAARACLRGKWLVLVVSFGLLGGVMTLPVGSEFFPGDLRDQFAIEVWLPESATIEQTDAAARRVEDIVRALSPSTDAEGNPIEGLRDMRTLVGGGGARWYLGRNPEAPKTNYAELMVRTTDPSLTAKFVDDIRRLATAGDERLGIEPVNGVRVIPRELMMGPPVKSEIELRIYGPRLGAGFADEKILRGAARGLCDIVAKQPGVWEAFDSWGSDAYQLFVDVDSDKANLAGVTNASVASTLNTYLTGRRLTTFREADHQIPVFLRLRPDERASVKTVRGAYVEGKYGKVPLESVATVEARWAPAKIERRYLMRRIDVAGRTERGVLANDIVENLIESDEFKQWAKTLPTGYWWEVGGALYESRLSNADLKTSVVISLLSIVLLLIIQFNGIVKPLIILMTLPLALIGAFSGLFLMGYPLGFMPLLGLLSLFGIIVNAAIIYIDYADRLIEEKARASDGSGPILGMSREAFRECLVRAGQVRLLPIAMTTLTTIGGLLPLGFAGGPMWEGLAWLMIFGLAVGTLLTLVVVPALYAIMAETFGIAPVRLEKEE